MKTGFDYYSEDLIRSAEKLLKDLEEFGRIKGALPVGGAGGETGNETADEPAAPQTENSPSADARIVIRVEKEGMAAFANLYPPKGPGKNLLLDRIRSEIAAAGIVHGIDWEIVEEALLQCTTGKKHVADVPVAEGQAPEDEVPARIEIEPRFVNRVPSPEESILRIDYREQTPFLFVKKDDPVARVLPAVTGREGRNIFGAAVPFSVKETREILPGPNTIQRGEEILAARDGRFIIEGNTFDVQEVLEIKGNVDYSTGNIRFGGDLIINGSVQEGFVLEVGGSILCKNSLDATRVTAGKDLVVLGGIIGKKKGIVRASGGVNSRFIEHAMVESKGPIHAEKAILHSLISSKDKVTLGKKGTVIGGKIYAQNGIVTNQLGSDMGTKTEIHIGVDPEVERKILWLQDKAVDIAVKLKEIKHRLAARSDDLRLIAVKDQLTSRRALIEETAQTLVGNLDKNEAASVTVSGYIFPGVTLEICHTLLLITEVGKNLRFYLDKTSGTVKSEDL